jgi:ketosteroid isomerase-like protein
MPETLSPEQVFRRLVDGVSRLVDGDVSQLDALANLYSERTHVVHPMSRGVPPLMSRADVRRHFTQMSAGSRGMHFRAEDVRIHHTADPEVVVAEFTYRGSAPAGPLSVGCVFVLRVRNGMIVESSDYIDPVAFARAAGRAEAAERGRRSTCGCS